MHISEYFINELIIHGGKQQLQLRKKIAIPFPQHPTTINDTSCAPPKKQRCLLEPSSIQHRQDPIRRSSSEQNRFCYPHPTRILRLTRLTMPSTKLSTNQPSHCNHQDLLPTIVVNQPIKLLIQPTSPW